jgi:hypothetical protein
MALQADSSLRLTAAARAENNSSGFFTRAVLAEVNADFLTWP